MSPEGPDDQPDELDDGVALLSPDEVANLRRALVHTAWCAAPTLSLTYDEGGDVLTARAVELPTARERHLHDDLTVRLDGEDGSAVLVELRLARFTAAQRSPAALRAREILGAAAWRRAVELTVSGQGETAVALGARERDALLTLWAGLASPVRTLGVHITSDQVHGVVVDEHGTVVDECTQRVVSPTPAAVVVAIVDLVAALAPVEAVGLQIGAPVDSDSGVVHTYYKGEAGGDDWIDAPIAERVRERTGRPVHLMNDVVALAVRERWAGLGRSEDRYGVLLVDEGIGGALVRDGLPDRDLPMELGNFAIHAAGRKCRCGGQGCVEATAGTWAIVERIRDDLGYSSVTDLASAVALVDRSRDPAVRAVFREAGEHLAVGIGSVQALMNLRTWVVYLPAALAGHSTAAASLRFGLEQFAASVSYEEYKHCAFKYEQFTGREAARGAALDALERHGLASPALHGG